MWFSVFLEPQLLAEKNIGSKDPKNNIHVDDVILDQDCGIQNSKSKLTYVSAWSNFTTQNLCYKVLFLNTKVTIIVKHVT